jgi:hypothetical protein
MRRTQPRDRGDVTGLAEDVRRLVAPEPTEPEARALKSASR